MKRIAAVPLWIILALFAGSLVSCLLDTGTPANPSNVHYVDGILYWTDNSDNEDGFEIWRAGFGLTISRCREDYIMRVGRNVTHCEVSNWIDLGVRAYKELPASNPFSDIVWLKSGC